MRTCTSGLVHRRLSVYSPRYCGITVSSSLMLVPGRRSVASSSTPLATSSRSLTCALLGSAPCEEHSGGKVSATTVILRDAMRRAGSLSQPLLLDGPACASPPLLRFLRVLCVETSVDPSSPPKQGTHTPHRPRPASVGGVLHERACVLPCILPMHSQ